MKNFRNVLLFHPFDRQTLTRATSLLTTHQAKMTLFTVVPPIERSKIKSSSGKIIDLQALLAKDHRQQLEEIAEPLKEQGFRISTKSSVGQPFIEIIRQVVAKKHDLVMMTADGQSTIRDQLFGTTSMHLMRKCPCPVWVIKPTRRKRLRSVLAAVDPNPEHGVRDSLNSEILQRAIQIARQEDADLHVVHAWNTLGGELDRGKRWMTRAEIRLHTEQVASDHRKRLDHLLQTETDGSAKVHMIQGRAGEVIPKIAAMEKVDLLVMGTVCRTGIPGFFIGNTAEMVLNQVDCSVLTVKPSGFISPVKL